MQRNELTDGDTSAWAVGKLSRRAGAVALNNQKTAFIREPIFSGVTRVWALGLSDVQRVVSYCVCGFLAHTSQALWEERLSPKSMMFFNFVFFFFNVEHFKEFICNWNVIVL